MSETEGKSPYHDPSNFYEYEPPKASAEENPDYMSMLAMFFSMFGLWFKYRSFAWLSLFCNMSAFASANSLTTDRKQIVMSSVLSLTAIALSARLALVGDETAATA